MKYFILFCVILPLTCLSTWAQAPEFRGHILVSPATPQIKLGGVVEVGHESVGTFFTSQLKGKLRSSREKEETVQLASDFIFVMDQSTFLQLASPDSPPRNRNGLIKLKTKTLVRKYLEIVDVPSSSVTTLSDVLSSIGSSIMVSSVNSISSTPAELESDLQNTAVVVSVLTVSQATLDGTTEQRSFSTPVVVGYQGGLVKRSLGALGNQPEISKLLPHEVSGMANANKVKVSAIETVPTGSKIGWISRMKLLSMGMMADDLPDSDFDWLDGKSPITNALSLWRGTFYFRIKKESLIQTQKIVFDLTTDQRNRKLKFDLE